MLRSVKVLLTNDKRKILKRTNNSLTIKIFNYSIRIRRGTTLLGSDKNLPSSSPDSSEQKSTFE